MNDFEDVDFEIDFSELEENRIKPEQNEIYGTCDLNDDECLSCGS
jgi:hypothetical protein